jgi:hypothetical protein
MRGEGRTVSEERGGITVRFDSLADRALYELRQRVQELVHQEDVAGAAALIVEAVTNGTVDDHDDLLTEIIDVEAEEIVRLEVEARLKKIEERIVGAIEPVWQPDDDD